MERKKKLRLTQISLLVIGALLIFFTYLKNNDDSRERIVSKEIQDEINKNSNIQNKDADIYVAHGSKDTTISIETHHKSMAFLKEKGLNPHEFVDGCGHTISKEMISDLTDWFFKRV